MQLHIILTEEDTDRGISTPGHCPIALAANRALIEAGFKGCRAEWEPYADIVHDATGFTVWKPQRLKPLCRLPVEQCPHEAYEFAELFDHWYRVGRGEENLAVGESPPLRPAPIAFTLELPLSPPT